MDDSLYISEVVEPDETGTNESYGLNTVETIKREDFLELTVPGCQHVWEIDPTDETEHYFSIKCANCPLGKLLDKSVHQKKDYV